MVIKLRSLGETLDKSQWRGGSKSLLGYCLYFERDRNTPIRRYAGLRCLFFPLSICSMFAILLDRTDIGFGLDDGAYC